MFNNNLIHFLNCHSTGVKLPRVSPDVILSTKISLPPENEISQIVEYIKKHFDNFDRLISIEKNRLKLLEEYKDSLILQNVLGKKVVN